MAIIFMAISLGRETGRCLPVLKLARLRFSLELELFRFPPAYFVKQRHAVRLGP